MQRASQAPDMTSDEDVRHSAGSLRCGTAPDSRQGEAVAQRHDQFDPQLLDLARHFAPDRYYSALLGPANSRCDLIALSAFAGELTRIGREVNTPLMAQIRLQWWRDSIEEMASGVTIAHPLAITLAARIRSGALNAGELDRCLAAAQDCHQHLPGADKRDWSIYAMQQIECQTALESRLFMMSCAILSDKDRSGLAPLCEKAGQLYAQARHVFDLAGSLEQDRLDLTVTHITRVAWQAHGRLRAVSAELAKAPRSIRQAFYPVALVEPYLQSALQSVQNSGRTANITPLQRIWRILRVHWGAGYGI